MVRFVYPQIYRHESILSEIRIEIGALAAWTPVTNKSIVPYTAEEYPEVFKTKGTVVRTVEAKRTFWEKATILHREAHRASGKIQDRYSRHYYDLFILSKTSIKEEAFRDLELLEQVVRFKEKFYRSPWAKYEEASPKKIKLVPSMGTIIRLRKDYDKMQDMIFGEKISFDTIIRGLTDLESEIHHLT